MQRRNTIEESDDPLSKWIHWVDRAIEAAQERGDFDNLPGHGKPLMIDEHPCAGDRALGFHVLNNAGIKPLWMELDREILHLRATMRALLDGRGTSRPLPEPTTDAARAPTPGWRHLLTVRRGRPSAGSRTRSGADAAERRARQDDLRLAAELDERLRLYNQTLPPELRHLERNRLPKEDAERTFDAALTR